MAPFPGHEVLSKKVGILAEDVRRFKESCSTLWWASAADFPQLRRAYTEKEQRHIEKELSVFIDRVSAEIKSYPSSTETQDVWIKNFVETLKDFGRTTFQIPDFNLDTVLQQGYVNSTRGFVDSVRSFDPSLKIEYVYQALRNVWIMNTLQVYMNCPIQHSEAIFAYSLLYPYTDNTLDDVVKSEEVKLSLIDNLRAWLEGGEARRSAPQEEKAFQLIKKIEKQYERKEFPGVFQSLLAIFNAQIRSLAQQRRHSLPYETDLLDISFEKGGTSVLADGYLVAGELMEHQADFCFGFGAFLQLCDDVQDAVEDKRNKHMTVFSQTCGQYTLDALTNKLFHFIPRILDDKLETSTDNRKRLREVILGNCNYLIMEAIGKNSPYYSRGYVQKIETHFPVRFSSLLKLRKKLKDKFFNARKKTVLDLDFISTVILTAISRTISGV